MNDKPDINIVTTSPKWMVVCNSCASNIIIKGLFGRCKCTTLTNSWGVYDMEKNDIVYMGHDFIRVH